MRFQLPSLVFSLLTQSYLAAAGPCKPPVRSPSSSTPVTTPPVISTPSLSIPYHTPVLSPSEIPTPTPGLTIPGVPILSLTTPLLSPTADIPTPGVPSPGIPTPSAQVSDVTTPVPTPATTPIPSPIETIKVPVPTEYAPLIGVDDRGNEYPIKLVNGYQAGSYFLEIGSGITSIHAEFDLEPMTGRFRAILDEDSTEIYQVTGWPNENTGGGEGALLWTQDHKSSVSYGSSFNYVSCIVDADDYLACTSEGGGRIYFSVTPGMEYLWTHQEDHEFGFEMVRVRINPRGGQP